METCNDQVTLTVTGINDNTTTIILNSEMTPSTEIKSQTTNTLPTLMGISSTELVQCLAEFTKQNNQTVTVTQPMECEGSALEENNLSLSDHVCLPDGSVAYNIERVLTENEINNLPTQEESSIVSREILMQPKEKESTSKIIDNDEDTLLLDAEDDEETGADEKGYSADNNTNDEENTVVIDVSNPIQLCHNSLIVVNGQKCVLQQNTDTGQLFAYPIKEPEKPRKKRGRPRKVKPSDDISGGGEDDSQSQDAGMCDEEMDAFEEDFEKGLIEKSNEAGEIVKRSTRRRKKTRQLNDYETGVLNFEGTTEDDDDGDEDDDEPPLKKKFGRGRTGRPKRGSPVQATRPLVSLLQPAKRGRGRPRRYGNKPETSQTQSFLIHLPEGQTLMMQVPTSNLPPGVTVQSVAQNIAESLNLPTGQTIFTAQQTKIPVAIAPRPVSLNTTSVNGKDVENPVKIENNEDIADNATQEDVVNVQLDVNEEDEKVATSTNATNITEVTKEKFVEEDSEEVKEAAGNATSVIPLPDNVVPLLLNKQDTPIKIGLKASENDLEKLRCPKCDFQAYYLQQFQEHLSSHPDDVHRCKCCSYLALQEDELYAHYKESHPKCICTVCNHTAEHAYMIKRHMYRHSDTGCSCELCGKTYKDHYILKMHMKMVHMPPEVLFECTVCSKKFSRKAHLKRHLRTHDPDKPYKCGRCDYRGCEKSDITKHMLIHEEPKHTCEVCGKTFRHIKNKELHVKRHKGQRDYVCGVCDFLGYTYTDIRKHIERKHSDDKSITCERCGQPFKTDALKKEHQANGQCELFLIDPAFNDSDLVTAASEGNDGANVTGEGQLEDVSDTTVALPDGTVATLSELAASGQIVLTDGKLHHIPHSQLVDSSGQLTIFTNDDGTTRVAMVTEQGELALVAEESEKCSETIDSQVIDESKGIEFSLEDDDNTFETNA